jgi:hypothetical protein
MAAFFIFAGVAYRVDVKMQTHKQTRVRKIGIGLQGFESASYWRVPEAIADLGATSFRSAK